MPIEALSDIRKAGVSAFETAGPGGQQQIFVQPNAPVVAGGIPYVWYQTGLGVDGTDMTVWVEDGL